jgi:hypothetical protein
MPTAVFPLIATWPLQHGLQVDNYIADFGDGFEQRVNFNLPFSRADGEGAVSSYVGRNQFTLRLNAMDFAVNAKTLWAFYKARKASFEAFYFYNCPVERTSPDLTGTDITGRYLVRFVDGNLTREQFTLKLFQASLTVIEVRS